MSCALRIKTPGAIKRVMDCGNWSTRNSCHADGNGNITYLVNSSQTVAASYRYDPYGNTISSSGGLASANVYRFSSKEIHVNSGLYYYGYRWYHPNLQRWLNRDPIEEDGGINLYGFVGNEPIFWIDDFGHGRRPGRQDRNYLHRDRNRRGRPSDEYIPQTYRPETHTPPKPSPSCVVIPMMRENQLDMLHAWEWNERMLHLLVDITMPHHPSPPYEYPSPIPPSPTPTPPGPTPPTLIQPPFQLAPGARLPRISIPPQPQPAPPATVCPANCVPSITVIGTYPTPRPTIGPAQSLHR